MLMNERLQNLYLRWCFYSDKLNTVIADLSEFYDLDYKARINNAMYNNFICKAEKTAGKLRDVEVQIHYEYDKYHLEDGIKELEDKYV